MDRQPEGPPGSNEAKTLQNDIKELGRGINALSGLNQVLSKTPPKKQSGILGQITGETQR
ncbi:MAG: hypothetical protein M1426_00890 [Patescibacteria group bacterium]|nr:hypothetical protein [Patescibacteria group bacterium]